MRAQYIIYYSSRSIFIDPVSLRMSNWFRYCVVGCICLRLFQCVVGHIFYNNHGTLVFWTCVFFICSCCFIRWNSWRINCRSVRFVFRFAFGMDLRYVFARGSGVGSGCASGVSSSSRYNVVLSTDTVVAFGLFWCVFRCTVFCVLNTCDLMCGLLHWICFCPMVWCIKRIITQRLF